MPGDPPDFYGKSSEDADNFIQAIHKIARDNGRSHDPEWMADLANVAFKGSARRWFNTLTFEQKHDWEKLEEALLQKYSSSDPATDPSNPISNPNVNLPNPIPGPNTNPWNPIPGPNTNPWNPTSGPGPNINPSNPLSGSGNYPPNSKPTSDSNSNTGSQNTITRRVKFVVKHDGINLNDIFYFDKDYIPGSLAYLLTRKPKDALIVNYTVVHISKTSAGV
ncbi:hypothetical protein PHLCEN_2v7157 [Hermanssonia centrifuga]|uniref:Retrotransposon gag domain-containing protein n=1 Tax=Hermanssonia centrifuga TaxID=98765 RepID=A0A2R6NXC5_9APHY|nr:hypothetical protein PHLCEN_2v7157 [Hermanssonia centrifuga]